MTEKRMKTTWRVINKDGSVVFEGPNGWYNEADEYIKNHKDKKDLSLDPEMNEVK